MTAPEVIEYPAVGFAVSFAIASQYFDILHDGMTLLVLGMTIFWLGVQIWAKIKVTRRATDRNPVDPPK